MKRTTWQALTISIWTVKRTKATEDWQYETSITNRKGTSLNSWGYFDMNRKRKQENHCSCHVPLQDGGHERKRICVQYYKTSSHPLNTNRFHLQSSKTGAGSHWFPLKKTWQRNSNHTHRNQERKTTVAREQEWNARHEEESNCWSRVRGNMRKESESTVAREQEWNTTNGGLSNCWSRVKVRRHR